jgi:glycosyltransferase involved in cell wall biosynthesis
MSGESPVPTVSVVVAAYNMARYVADAVRSVLAQTYTDLEVIVIDDGSTDGTADVMKVFEGDPRVKYVRQANLGQPRAKNAGILAARGRFIAFCDADDLWVPNKLERQLPRFDADPKVGVVYCRTAMITAEGERNGEFSPDAPSGDILRTLFVKNVVPFGTAVVRREVLDTLGRFDESLAMGIDWDLWLRVSTRWHFEFVPESLYLYRVWGGQMSRNWKGRYEHVFRIMQKFLDDYPGVLPKAVVRRAYADSYLGRGICAMLIGSAPDDARHDFIRAIRVEPWFWSAWRELIKLVVFRRRAGAAS